MKDQRCFPEEMTPANKHVLEMIIDNPSEHLLNERDKEHFGLRALQRKYTRKNLYESIRTVLLYQLFNLMYSIKELTKMSNPCSNTLNF